MIAVFSDDELDTNCVFEVEYDGFEERISVNTFNCIDFYMVI